MKERRTFEQAKRETADYHDALEALREEVRAAVREEIRSSALDRAQVERLVTELVARELRTAGGPWWRLGAVDDREAWQRGALAAAGVIVLLAAAAFAGARFLGGASPADASSSPAIVSGVPTSPAAPPTAEVLAARFDSLYERRDSVLAPLVRDVAEATSAVAVREAALGWSNGALGPEADERLRAALAQAALNHFVVPPDSPLAVDGVIQRVPCGGRSCAALLAAWRARPGGVPMPPFDTSAGEAPLRVVERALIMARTMSP